MKKVFVLFILAFGFGWASSASADPPARFAQASARRAGEAGETYTVRRGDRLNEVAERFGVTLEELLAANPRTAYGVSCKNPHTVELRDGHMRAICGGDEPYLIAGKTLIVPESRLLLQSENVRLNSEIVVLQAELNRANEERDAIAQERDALWQERDRLATANAELANANTAMADSNNEFASRYSEARAAADANSVNRRASEVESRETTVTVVAVISVAIVVFAIVFAIVFVWWSGRPLRHLERDRAHLELTRQSVVKEAEDLVGRRRTLEEEEQRRRLALTEEEDKQKALRVELTRWKGELEERNNRASARKREQDERGTSLEGRESACTAREDGVTRRAEELGRLEGKLLVRDKELGDKERGVEELRRSLNAEKARQERKEFEQNQREEDLVRLFEDLTTRGKRLHAELDARRELLDNREAEVDGKVRMFDQDIQPQLATYVDREAALHKREEVVANREQAAARLEGDLGLRVEEFQEAKAELERREGSLHVGEQELERRQIDLANERAGFDQEMTAAREAFKQEMTDACAAFEREKAEARGLLTRARRKAEIVRTLNEREAAVAAREEAVRQREERERALAGVPKSKLPRRPTMPAPFAPSSVGGVDDDSPTAVVLPEPSEGGVDPRAITNVNAPGSEPAMDVSKCLCPVCGNEVQFGKLDEHLAQAHSGATASCDAGQTGPQIPVASKPSQEEGGIYCNHCGRLIPADEYVKDGHKDHNT